MPAIGHKCQDTNIFAFSNPADHARTIKFSNKIKAVKRKLFYKESRFQASLCLISRSLSYGHNLSSFPLRRFYCQGTDDRNK